MDASDVKSVPDIKVEPIDEDNIVNDDKNLYLQNYNDFDKEIMPNVVTKLGNTMGKTDSIENNVTTVHHAETLHSEIESDEILDECYSCFMCNISYDSQVELDSHLRGHINDETFHHSNIDSISEPLPCSSIRPSKYLKCHECLKVCKSQLSFNEHMLTHTGEKPHHCMVCDRKFRHIANFRTHLKSHDSIRSLVCSLCKKTIVGEKNYYIHYMDVHNKVSGLNPRHYQTSSSDSDEDFNPKVSYYKKKKLGSRKFRKDENEPFGPLFAKKAWEQKKRELENCNSDVENEKSEREAVQEAIESSRQDIQNMLKKRKQQLTVYNNKEYQKQIENLILEKNSTGKINGAKLIGPLFWKNALVKAGLLEEDVQPIQFQSKLRLIECVSCKKCFARLPKPDENNVSSSKSPCSDCFMIKNETVLNKHKVENHTSENPPYKCKECSSELNTWYKYVQHMKMHLRYALKCSECLYNMTHKPGCVIFLCHVCDTSFDTDEQLRLHVYTHLENGQHDDDR